MADTSGTVVAIPDELWQHADNVQLLKEAVDELAEDEQAKLKIDVLSQLKPILFASQKLEKTLHELNEKGFEVEHSDAVVYGPDDKGGTQPDFAGKPFVLFKVLTSKLGVLHLIGFFRENRRHQTELFVRAAGNWAVRVNPYTMSVTADTIVPVYSYDWAQDKMAAAITSLEKALDSHQHGFEWECGHILQNFNLNRTLFSTLDFLPIDEDYSKLSDMTSQVVNSGDLGSYSKLVSQWLQGSIEDVPLKEGVAYSLQLMVTTLLAEPVRYLPIHTTNMMLLDLLESGAVSDDHSFVEQFVNNPLGFDREVALAEEDELHLATVIRMYKILQVWKQHRLEYVSSLLPDTQDVPSDVKVAGYLYAISAVYPSKENAKALAAAMDECVEREMKKAGYCKCSDANEQSTN